MRVPKLALARYSLGRGPRRKSGISARTGGCSCLVALYVSSCRRMRSSGSIGCGTNADRGFKVRRDVLRHAPEVERAALTAGRELELRFHASVYSAPVAPLRGTKECGGVGNASDSPPSRSCAPLRPAPSSPLAAAIFDCEMVIFISSISFSFSSRSFCARHASEGGAPCDPCARGRSVVLGHRVLATHSPALFLAHGPYRWP